MTTPEEILRLKTKPKERQTKLVAAVVSKKIPMRVFVTFFESASDVDKGTCADVMKHISAESPALLAPFIDVLIKYINYKAPRVKWGVPEAIGNLSKKYPDETAKAIPFLLKNTTEDPINTTVIRWCAAFALTQIARNNARTRKRLIPIFERAVQREKNSGVRNAYVETLKMISLQAS